LWEYDVHNYTDDRVQEQDETIKWLKQELLALKEVAEDENKLNKEKERKKV
jgi:hypothetical protein